MLILNTKVLVVEVAAAANINLFIFMVGNIALGGTYLAGSRIRGIIHFDIRCNSCANC